MDTARLSGENYGQDVLFAFPTLKGSTIDSTTHAIAALCRGGSNISNNRGLSVTILAMGVQKEAVAREARQLGGSGGMPPP